VKNPEKGDKISEEDIEKESTENPEEKTAEAAKRNSNARKNTALAEDDSSQGSLLGPSVTTPDGPVRHWPGRQRGATKKAG